MTYDIDAGSSSVSLPVDPSDDERLAKLKRAVASSLRRAFSAGLSDDQLSKVLEKEPKDEGWVGELESLFALFGWQVTEEQVQRLAGVVASLSGFAAAKLKRLIGALHEIRGELALAQSALKSVVNSEWREAKPRFYAEAAYLYLRVLSKLRHPDAHAAMQDALRAARQAGSLTGAAWVLDRWGKHLWNQGAFDEAVRFMTEASDQYRADGNQRALVRYLLGLSEKQERVDRDLAVRTAAEACELLSQANFSAHDEARAKLTIASISFRANKKLDEAQTQAIEGFTTFSTNASYEAEAARAAALVVGISRALGDAETAGAFAANEERYLSLVRSDRELFRGALRRAVDTDGETLGQLADLEAAALRLRDPLLYADWAGAYGLALHDAGKPTEALALFEYAFSRVVACDDAGDCVSVLQQGRAVCLKALDRHREGIEALEAAVAADPGDRNLRFSLINEAVSSGMDEPALRQCEYLIATAANVNPGAHRLAASIYASRRCFTKAREILDAARILFPDHPGIARERKEAFELEVGAITIAETEYLRIPKTIGIAPPEPILSL